MLEADSLRADQLSIACRHFFISWLQRSESLKGRWQRRHPSPLCSLDHKIQHLRDEIAGLTAQDTELFYQLFTLQDSIDELRERFGGGGISYAESASAMGTATGDANVLPTSECCCCSPHISLPLTAHTSFVRQRVSYPPSSRNRCRRSQTLQQQPPLRPKTNRPVNRRPRSAASAVRADFEIFV